MKSDNIILQGKCIKALPGVKFYVKLHHTQNNNLSFLNTKVITAKVCGRMINKKIRLSVGDNVELEVSITDICGLKKYGTLQNVLGRIKKRLMQKN
jgi:translation initiation factor IF-1